MTQHSYDEVTRLYAVVEASTAEADKAWAVYQRLRGDADKAYAAYQNKCQVEHEARRAWLAAGDKVFAA